MTVLDFIGNNYDRSVQIALALGTLGKTTYTEKVYLKDLVKSDFNMLNIPGLKICIDELAKEEIIDYINRENFNKKSFMKKDYENFKKYLNNNSIPTHMDYLESEIAPDLIRFLKTKIGSKRVTSYYNFLKYIGEENIPLYSDDENVFIDLIEELIPIVRVDEFLILKDLLNDSELNLENLIGYNSRVNLLSLTNALEYLNEKVFLIRIS